MVSAALGPGHRFSVWVNHLHVTMRAPGVRGAVVRFGVLVCDKQRFVKFCPQHSVVPRQRLLG
jgi:hypothetical protein